MYTHEAQHRAQSYTGRGDIYTSDPIDEYQVSNKKHTHTWGALGAASNSGDKGRMEKLPRGTNILINLIVDLFTFEKNKHHFPEMLLELGILEIVTQVNVPRPRPWVNKY